MNPLILLLLSALPVAIIVFFIYKKDKEKESKGLLIKLFVGGVISTFLVLVISIVLSKLFPVFAIDSTKLKGIDLAINVFIGIALVEELCKFLATYFVSYNHKEHNYSFDMIIYSVFVSLGFAFFENIFYVTQGGVSIALWRAISAVPLHACLGAVIGIYLSKAKTCELEGYRIKSNRYKVLGLLYAIIIHGSYDYCIFFNTYLSLLVLIIITSLTFVFTFISIVKLSKNDKKIIFDNNFCPFCGTKVSKEICPICGNKND